MTLHNHGAQSGIATTGTARALLTAARPRQWVKNVLVVAAPLAAGTLLVPDVAVPTMVAFLSFCCVASGAYLVNDVRDVEEDRAHPTKRHRPIAAGQVSSRVALTAAAVLVVAGLAIATIAGTGLVVLVAGYVLLSVGYSWRLKNQTVFDLAIVAAGFLLRAMAGGIAAGIVLSQWFLLAAAFGSLFVVAGKRYSEVVLVGEGEGSTRRALGTYSISYLRFVWTLSATITIATYSLWAFEMSDTFVRPVLAQTSIAPFVLATLRYAVDIDRGDAGEPEDIVLSDRVLQALGVIWVVLFATGVTGI